MKISVLCPTYNAGETLAQTLQSVIDQNDPNFEIIIADGGSSDQTLSIAKRYEPSVTHILTGPDEGQLHAVHRAGAVASGDILYWLNADDIVMPGAFKEARDKLSSPHVDFVYSDNFAFSSDRRELYVGPTIRGLRRVFHEVFYRQLYSETVFMKSFLWPSPNVSEYSLRVYTDYAFFIRALTGAKGCWTPKRLGAFRVVAGQASQRHSERKLSEFRAIRNAYYSDRGWSALGVFLRRLIAAPEFFILHFLWPSLERGGRWIVRLVTRDSKRFDQTRVFFDQWLLEGPPDAAGEFRSSLGDICEPELFR